MSAKIPENLSKPFEQIGNKLKNLDEKNLYYLFGGILVLIFVIDYLVLMSPQLNSLYKLGPNIATLNDNITKAKNDASQVEHYKKEIDRLTEEIEILRGEVRSKEEVSIILEQVSLIADKNKIKIDQIAPVFQDQTKILDSKDAVYYTLPIDIDARASYHDLGRFINELENANLYFKISAFSIAHTEESKYNVVKLTILAIIFEKPKKVEKK
jgi:Tfp pilus assembly protein PilO